MRALVRRAAIEEADEGDRALGARGERPCQCCATDEKLPPPHASSPRCRRLYASEFGDGARIGSGSDPELFDGDFLDVFADAQTFRAQAVLAAAFHRDGYAAARHRAEAALVEDVCVVEAAAPAFEVADLGS